MSQPLTPRQRERLLAIYAAARDRTTDTYTPEEWGGLALACGCSDKYVRGLMEQERCKREFTEASE